MRLTWRILSVAVGFFRAAMTGAGCHGASEPFTPSGAHVTERLAPAPGLFHEAGTVVTALTFENRDDAEVIVAKTTDGPPDVEQIKETCHRQLSLTGTTALQTHVV